MKNGLTEDDQIVANSGGEVYLAPRWKINHFNKKGKIVGFALVDHPKHGPVTMYGKTAQRWRKEKSKNPNYGRAEAVKWLIDSIRNQVVDFSNLEE